MHDRKLDRLDDFLDVLVKTLGSELLKSLPQDVIRSFYGLQGLRILRDARKLIK